MDFVTPVWEIRQITKVKISQSVSDQSTKENRSSNQSINQSTVPVTKLITVKLSMSVSEPVSMTNQVPFTTIISSHSASARMPNSAASSINKSLKSFRERANVHVKSKKVHSQQSARTGTVTKPYCLSTEQRATERLAKQASRKSQPIKQTISRQIKQSINKPIDQPVKQLINPVKPSKKRGTTVKPFKLSTNRSVRQSAHPSSDVSVSSSPSPSTSIKLKQSSTSFTTTPTAARAAIWDVKMAAKKRIKSEVRCVRPKSIAHVRHLLTRPVFKPVPRSLVPMVFRAFHFSLDERVRVWNQFVVEQKFDLAAYRKTLVHSPLPLPSFYRSIKQRS